MQFDAVIVGQGLAGSLLAWRLHHAGIRILVVDPGGNNASRIAAGLVTPVTGKRWVKTEGVDELLPEARNCYRHLEQVLGTPLWFEHPTLRLYRDESERQLARRRANEFSYQDYLGEELEPGKAGFDLADRYGSRWLLHSAHLATQSLLDQLRRWLQRQGRLLQMNLDPKDLALTRKGARWLDIQTATVVFCEGWQVIHNPWFASLPWQPSQGQILTLTRSTVLPPFPVNRGIWMLPEGPDRCRIGATYRWQPLTGLANRQDRQQLLSQFTQLFHHSSQARVLEEAAGIRPNTLDHRPIVGRHPRYPQLVICNGLGSKGSLYAPNVCRQLCDHLLHDTPLPLTISLQRYHAYLSD